MAPADDDISIEEKRVYAGRAGRTDAYIATGSGVVRVSISADKIGGFELVADTPTADVAVRAKRGGPPLLALATDEGLRVAPLSDETSDLTLSTVTDSPAIAVDGTEKGFLVGTAEGTIEHLEIVSTAVDTDGATVEHTHTAQIGSVPEPRAIDWPLIATVEGVYQVDSTGTHETLTRVGLGDVNDVSGVGVPLAATTDGLYWLGNGWMTAINRPTTLVASDGDGHAMAVVDGEMIVHNGGESDPSGWDGNTWTTHPLPVDETPVAVGYGPGVSAVVTEAGTVCVDVGDGWRHHVVGVRTVRSVALAASA